MYIISIVLGKHTDMDVNSGEMSFIVRILRFPKWVLFLFEIPVLQRDSQHNICVIKNFIKYSVCISLELHTNWISQVQANSSGTTRKKVQKILNIRHRTEIITMDPLY